MLLADQNVPNDNLSRLLSSCSNLPLKDAYEKSILFLKTHYNPRETKNFPALFSAITQIISAFGGREIQTIAAQNAVMALFASVSSAMVKTKIQKEEDTISRINSSSTNESSRQSTRASLENARWQNFDNFSPDIFSRQASFSDAESQDNNVISSFSIPVKEKHLNNFREITSDIAKERFFDLMLFSVACGYKVAGGPTFLSAESTNALVWDLLSASQQGLAQALSYIMYRNYAWTLTVLCSIATNIIDVMNKTPNANTKAILYSAMLGIIVGVSMIAVNYIEHQSVLAAGNAKRPNQEAAAWQREHQRDEFENHLNSWEKVGFYPSALSACQDLEAENKDMFSGHVSTLAVEAFSIYQLSRAISEKYPNNLSIKYLSRTLFVIACAFTGETAATRVLGDCHTLESVMIASTKFNSPAIMAKFLGELLDLALTKPEIFVIAAKGRWKGLTATRVNNGNMELRASLSQNSMLNDSPIHATDSTDRKENQFSNVI